MADGHARLARPRDRDSHDLSEQLTRHSVVDSMLLSLAGFQNDPFTSSNSAVTSGQTTPTLASPFEMPGTTNRSSQQNSYNAGAPSTPKRSRRSRGHTYSSSASTDPEYRNEDVATMLGIDDIASRYTAYHNQGSLGHLKSHGSNAAGRSRKHLSREGTFPPATYAGPHDEQSQDPDDEDMASKTKTLLNGISHKKKSSGGSMRITPRRAPRPPPLTNSTYKNDTQVEYHPEHLNNNENAAPTPTIPGGPRRHNQHLQELPSPAIPPLTPNGKKNSGPSRSNSVKSSRTLKKGKSKDVANAQQDTVRDQARQFVTATNNMRVNSATGSAAPSPTVGGMKHAFPSPTLVMSPQQPVQKEKTGFFRRVFGGGSSKDKQREDSAGVNGNNNAGGRSSGPERPKTQPGPGQTLSSQFKGGVSSGGSSTRPPTQDPSAGSRGGDIAIHGSQSYLRKSSSSFFRRRKKSIGDAGNNYGDHAEAIPPVPPLDLSQHQQFSKLSLQTSEGPSLRNIMAPYLQPFVGTTVLEEIRSASPEEMFFDSREVPLSNDDHLIRSISDGTQGAKSKNTGPGAKPLPIKALSSGSTSGERGLAMLSPGDRQASAPVGSSLLGRDEKHTLHRQQSSTALSPAGLSQSINGTSNSQLSAFKASVYLDAENSTSISDLSMTLSLLGGGASKSSPVSDTYPTSVAPMPKRPAPVAPRPDAMANVRAALLSVKGAAKPLLSPISDRSFPSETMGTNPAGSVEEFVASPKDGDAKSQKGKTGRVWLRPTESEERLAERAGDRDRPALDRQHTQSSVNSNANQKTNGSSRRLSPGPETPGTTGTSDNEIFASVGSLPVAQVESRDGHRPSSSALSASASDAMDGARSSVSRKADAEITDQDRERARQIFEGDETFLSKASATAWMGMNAPENTRTRRAYMELYDWRGVNVLAAFRELCSRLIVRAESQQLDRVIDAFSARWCDCNPHHGFKDQDVVHTLAFSILMLNTDLHLADMDQRMTRSQFVKNTLPTIRSIADLAVGNSDTMRINPEKQQNSLDIPSPTPHTPSERPSLDALVGSSAASNYNKNRLSRSVGRHDSDNLAESSDGSNLLVNAPFEGSMKAWETQVESILKDFYNSIRNERLPLHGASAEESNTNSLKSRQQSNASLSVINTLRRTPSVLSKAPSENASFRGRPGDLRSATSRFASKSRTRPKLYPSSTMGSSRTSLDDQSMWSPAASTFTKYSVGKTQNSFSVESLGSWGRGTGIPQAIGFANAISQAIIREEQGTNKDGLMSSADSIDFGRTVPLLEDETLELYGPPWAKEGILKHKLHDKRTKDARGWTECFAVVEKGCMRLFSFNQTGHSGSGIKGGLFKNLRYKGKNATSSNAESGQIVGGGNWLDNAQELGSFTLRQTYATPVARDHSKTQHHIWALMLPTGAVHSFACGSNEGRDEWISTANYWSARLSKEPLLGGVSNAEYGWSDNIVNAVPPATPTSISGSISFGDSTGAVGPLHSRNGSRASRANSIAHVSGPPATAGSRPASASVGRSSLDYGTGYHGYHGRARLPGDKAVISDWRPPVSSMMASQLMEVDQRSALMAYVKEVEEELVKHNELRPMMAKAFSPRHPNAGKAVNNWNAKCSYLHTEIYKYRTYIEALNHANKVKDKIYAEREEDRLKKEAEEARIDVEQINQNIVDPGGDLERADGSPELIEQGSS